ncbi:ArgK/MeaB family GTPase [Picrophilus oshimae]|uniref:LAO/AO transport system kinase n=1 Tax=Picrophilus torridus (strain ATCC 700027 / DSM 9790 / JCM 10055 / NBRC 100828 / KAW 2/3) TaxID=1122961 RepID=Q6L2E6_PICTO|nr:LAO/AO transport system kinase ArgK [Picrophilus oshimae]AAT42856.1 LAO/AO transport system kinase ArgK [Picrophilus oshimae DSM 9789]SMD31617.1 LAO/AO transport system kinase [Picrophilus oshimae DSM 9789]
MYLDQIIAGLKSGDRRSIARCISIMENGDDDDRRYIIERIFNLGNARIIGITGPPGVGKSTIIGRLAPMLNNKAVTSVLAIDPSSPFSGGSILGNRIRMQESLSKYGIYMRSTANRMYEGGLSEYTWDIIKVLEASGSRNIIIETVGSGQADLDIMNYADITLVVLSPGLGDEIQALKSGLMEIGDIFVLNKMDLEGSYLAMKEIMNVLSIKDNRPPVIGINSITGEGYNELLSEIEKIKKNNKNLRYKRKLKQVIISDLYKRYSSIIENMVIDYNIDPYSLANDIIKIE